MMRQGSKKTSKRLQKSQAIFKPSMTELCRVAESRFHTAIAINRRAPGEFEAEVRKEQRHLWRFGATTKSDIRVSILSIILDFLAGNRKSDAASGPSIRELALRQLDRDMVSDSQNEATWERHYQNRHERLVKAGREDSEEAEKLTILVETSKLYRAKGVFMNNEYNPSNAGGSEGRDKRECFFGTEMA